MIRIFTPLLNIKYGAVKKRFRAVNNKNRTINRRGGREGDKISVRRRFLCGPARPPGDACQSYFRDFPGSVEKLLILRWTTGSL